MTAIRPCPACGREDTTKALADMSQRLDVNYFRCVACGHVWITFQDGRLAQHVTPLKDHQRAR